jgi:hypothetical protein
MWLYQMILVEDAGGDLHFDSQELACPLDTLGFFLGYMSGPIIPETVEEQQARLKEEAEMIELPIDPAVFPAPSSEGDITITGLRQHDQFQWGSMILVLDEKRFRDTFVWGHRIYFEEINGEHPERAHRMTVADITETVLIRDASGRLRFQNDRIVHPFETLGTFLGYLSGPLNPETAGERQARHREEEAMVVIEETIPIS